MSFLNLNDYEYSVVHEEVVEDSRASVSIWDIAEGALFGLSPVYTDCDKPTKTKMESFAFHEVMELRLFQLGRIAMSRDFDPDELERETHKIIRVFENKVFPFINGLNCTVVKKPKGITK